MGRRVTCSFVRGTRGGQGDKVCDTKVPEWSQFTGLVPVDINYQ